MTDGGATDGGRAHGQHEVHRPGRRLTALVAVLILLAPGAAACEAVPDLGSVARPGSSSGSTSASSGSPGRTRPDPGVAGALPAERALARLGDLVVAPRTHRGDYRREAFGDGWGRRAGCDVRDLVLARHLHDVVRDPDDRCRVTAGTLADPYTGRTVRYVRGEPARGVDVDHLVPLRNAWQSGAAGWTAARREAFANDLLVLQPTSASVNRSKGDGPVDAWLPPDRAYRCTYARRWVTVKTSWRLTITPTERAVLERLLRSCSPA